MTHHTSQLRSTTRWLSIPLLVAFAACSSGSKSASQSTALNPSAVKSFEVVLASSSVPAGTKVSPISARATFVDGTSRDVTAQSTWSASNGALVSFLPAQAALVALAPGTTEITATYSGISASRQLTIANGIVLSLSLNPASATVAKGTKQQLRAIAILSDGKRDVTSGATWSTSDSSIATVDANGNVSAISPGNATVTASYGNAAITAKIAVTNATLQSLSISGPGVGGGSVSIPAGVDVALGLTGSFSDGNTQSLADQVQWTSSDTSVATVDGNGVVHAVGTGTATITATTGDGASSSVTVVVTSATLTGVAVVPSTATVIKGTGLQLQAKGTFTDGTSVDISSQVAWSSSSPEAATVSAGYVAAKDAGSATVTATFGSFSGSAVITVPAAVIQSIVVTPASASKPAGTKQQFTATGNVSDGTNVDLTKQVGWTVSNAQVASISNLDANAGEAIAAQPGTATVKATFPGFSATATLTVTNATISSISLSTGSGDASNGISLANGTSTQVTGTATYSDGRQSVIPITWTSGDTSIVTVGADGTITAVGTGSTTITGTLPDGTTVTIPVTVTAAVVRTVTVAPPAVALRVGQSSAPLSATVLFSDATTQLVTSGVTWTSSSNSVAIVSAAGVVTGQAAGSASITATYMGVTSAAGAIVTVTPVPVLNGITITPPGPLSLTAGANQQLAATGTYSDGSSKDLTASVSWTSTAPTVVAVAQNGLATAGNGGTASVTATLGAITSAAVSFTVTGSPGTTLVIESILINPSSAQLGVGDHVQLSAIGSYSDGATTNTSDVTSSASWSSSDETIVTVSGGNVVAGSNTGTATITATYSGISGTATVTVSASAPPPTPVTLQKIVVAPLDGVNSTPAGVPAAMVATGWYSAGDPTTLASADVTWTSTNPAVATVSADGVVTPKPGVTSGSTTIIATSIDGLVASDPLPFSVTSAVLNSISLDPGVASIAIGTTAIMSVTGYYSDGSALDLTSSLAQAAWSFDSSLLSFQAPGMFKGLAATPGTPVNATAQCSSGNSTAPCTDPAGATTVVVRAANLLSIQITSSEGNSQIQTLPPGPGVSDQLSAIGTFDDGSTQDLTTDPGLTWTSSDVTVASFDPSTPGVLQTNQAGSTTISAKMLGVTGTMVVTVTNARLTGLSVSPVAPSVPLQFAIQLNALGQYSDGTKYPLTEGALWSSADTTKVTVSNTPGTRGSAFGVALGSTVVKAQVGAYAASVTVTVTNATLTDIVVSTVRGANQPVGNFSLSVGQTRTLYATGVFTNNAVLDITQQCNWHTAPKLVASIQKTRAGAVVAATRAGTTKITPRKGSQRPSNANIPQLTVH